MTDDWEVSGDAGPTAGPAGMERWDDVLTDMASTASAYEAEGWTAFQLHPGDVTPRPGSGDHRPDPGLDILIPDNEFEPLSNLLESGFEVNAVDVYRARSTDLQYLVFALEDGTREDVVLVPAYYRPDLRQSTATIEAARNVGELTLYVRRLSGEMHRFTIENPELVGPSNEEPNDAHQELTPDNEKTGDESQY